MIPDHVLTCLLVQPKFSINNYWNYVDVAENLGAKTPAPPLGLLTVAALLPQHWKLKVVDLNVREIADAEWDEADLICVGGMLPQQPGILKILERAKASGKYCVVGGADPTSQPIVYREADALVLGEGEASIPIWLAAWRDGRPCGVFEAAQRPDVATSPVPRFDLIDFKDYVHIGIQFSRGCPFNCEFCDIIELYGRVPRSKTSAQLLAELDRLYELGYRGWVDLVDDNFIGNKRQVKPMLVALQRWCQEKNYPFHFSTEATLNLADDDELLALMRQVDFRHIFMGIETPDPELLALTQKRVNSMRPIQERLDRVYSHGMTVAAGFILGFDNEKPGNDKVIIDFIEESGIVVAMVGLLVALPNTQLTRRLQREGRLLSPDLTLFTDTDGSYQIETSGQHGESDDNQASGLNFVTSRDRAEVYREYRNIIDSIFSPRNFMDRVLATAKKAKFSHRHKPSVWELKREIRSLLRTAWWMTKNKSVRWYYWRNTIRTLFLGMDKFDYAQRMMAMFRHFQRQSQYVINQVDVNIDFAIHHATYPREMSEMNVDVPLPQIHNPLLEVQTPDPVR